MWVSGEDEVLDEVGTPACVGQHLRIARDAQGLTIDEIAARTRIPKRHLITIEDCRYDDLPAPTYTIGFVRTWGRVLGLDGQDLAEQFRAEIGGLSTPNTQPLPYEPADPRRTPPAGLALAALLIAAVLALGYIYWRGTAEQPAAIATMASDQPATPAPAATPAPQAIVPTSPANTPAQPAGPVLIGATQDVWIKVSDGGKTLFMNVLHPGDHFQVPADAVAPLLTTGRPGNTTITVGQAQIPPVGDPRRAAKDVSLKTTDLLARITPAPTVAPSPANAAAPVENTAGT